VYTVSPVSFSLSTFISLINARWIYPRILRIARYLSRRSIVSSNSRGRAVPAWRPVYFLSHGDVSRSQTYAMLEGIIREFHKVDSWI